MSRYLAEATLLQNSLKVDLGKLLGAGQIAHTAGARQRIGGAREAVCNASASQESKQERGRKILSSTLYYHSLTLCQLAKEKCLKSSIPVLEQALNLGDRTILNKQRRKICRHLYRCLKDI